MSLNIDDYYYKSCVTECFMSERFIRLNGKDSMLLILIVDIYADLKMINSTVALVHSGRVVSFLDLSSKERKWTHYLSDDMFTTKKDFTLDR